MLHPHGVRELANGSTWNTIAGKPMEDSEMVPLLARMLTERGIYDPNDALQAYRFRLDSEPFDCGMTISANLRGCPNPDSQTKGAMKRISPLSIFGANHPLKIMSERARQDATLTHPNLVCLHGNAPFTMAIAHAIASGYEADKLYQKIRQWALYIAVEPALMDTIHGTAGAPAANYDQQQG